MIEIKKGECTFKIGNKYINEFDTEQESTIILKINYISKTYDILPLNSTSFRFTVGSHKHSLWTSIAESIKQAIKFANNELNIE